MGAGNGDDRHGDGREKNGQFAPGHRISARPRTTRKRKLRWLFERSITADGMKLAAANLMTQATTNTEDVAAIKLFLEYAIGKPEPDGEDGRGNADVDEILQFYTTAVLLALKPFPDARLAVATALRNINPDRPAIEDGGGEDDD